MEKTTLESAAASPGPLLHPLAGSSLANFIPLIWRHAREGYSQRAILRILVAAALQPWRGFLGGLEQLRRGRAIARHRLPEPPVFIVGYWGSGTTHLHNLLSQNPRFDFVDFGQAFMPWNQFEGAEICRSIVRATLPRTRGFDAVRIAVDEPQEEEFALANMNSVSFYHTHYFPRNIDHHFRRALFFEGVSETERRRFERNYQFLARKVSLQRGGKRLLLKNPASTTRIPMLKRLFPDAKFIHIVRSPGSVYLSALRRIPKLLNFFALQDFTDLDLHRFIVETYRSVMRRYLEDREKLDLSERYEMRYESLVEDPLAEISKIHDALELPGRRAGLAAAERYLADLGEYRPGPQALTPEMAAPLEEHWGFSFDFWNYPLPSEGIISRPG